MTIQQAMEALELVKPNALPVPAKLQALTALDSTVFRELMATHEGADCTRFDGYTTDTDFGTALLIPAPYDQMYLYWLMSRVDLANNEIDRYQNSAGLFNEAWGACVRWYNRTHRPLGQARFAAKGAGA